MAQSRQKVVQAAEKLAARGRIQAAIDEYRKVLDRHPNDTSTLNRVGDLYVRLNRMEKAIELFQKTAESFGRQGFFVKAIAIYKKIIRLDPGQIRAYEALADLYNRQGLTGDALAQYQVVAEYHVKHGDNESAVNIYYSMVGIEPNNPSRRLKLASLLQTHGKPAKALEQYYEIASLMLAHARGDDALRVLTGALDVDAQNLDFVRKAMGALGDAGFDRLGEELLEAAVKRNPQANVLRLDALEAPRAKEAKPQPAPEPEATAEPEPKAAVPAKVEEEGTQPEDSEIDLSELEVLPAPVELDPAIEVEAAPAAAADAESEDLAEESSFELDDAEEPAAEEPEIAVESSAPVPRDDDFSFELDIDEVSAELAQVDSKPEVAAIEAEEAAETLQGSGAEEVAEIPREEPAKSTSESVKLLIEADVLSRYGMDEMAISVLERVLQADSENSEAMARVVLLKLRSDRADEALVVANDLADLVTRGTPPQAWEELVGAMAERGFELARGRFVGEVAAAPPKKPAAAAVEQAPAAKAPAVEKPVIEETAAAVEGDAHSLEEIVAETAALARPKRKPVPESTEDLLADVIHEIEREGKGRQAAPVDKKPAAIEEPEAEAVDAAAVEEEADVEWIRELERVDAADESTAPLEPGTGEFVDLATELEAELSDGPDFEDELLPMMGEQSLEDIVEGFRQGMAETLSDEDYDTHYNLGIAYREMGLLDEAIGEFQLAAKDPRYLVECCSLLASCFVDKNFHDLAVQWYVRGLDSSAIDEESRCGLLYELGSLLAATGEPEAARERFLELYGVNSNYRDVVAKLEELPT